MLGFSAPAIKHRVATGRLHPVLRGVYAVGRPELTRHGRWIAAVLSCGAGAALSHEAAGALWEIWRPGSQGADVYVPRPRQARLPGIRVHRCRTLPPEDLTHRHRIPITTVARTLVDLAGVLSADEMARACHEAGVRYDTTPAQVEAVLGRRARTVGIGKLRAIFSGDTPVTLSRLERRFLKLLREHGLPLPTTNRPAGARRVDCHWPELRLIVELDSYQFHRSRYAWEQDRRREREARAAGYEFRRYTWGDVFEHPRLMLRELRELTCSGVA